jgi:hypothetical protein
MEGRKGERTRGESLEMKAEGRRERNREAEMDDGNEIAPDGDPNAGLSNANTPFKY